MFSEFCFCSTGLITYGYDTSFILWPDIILHALRSKGDVTCWIVFSRDLLPKNISDIIPETWKVTAAVLLSSLSPAISRRDFLVSPNFSATFMTRKRSTSYDKSLVRLGCRSSFPHHLCRSLERWGKGSWSSVSFRVRHLIDLNTTDRIIIGLLCFFSSFMSRIFP